MGELIIPFNAWSEDKLRRGVKICTSRRQAYGVAGDTFTVVGREWLVVAVARVPLWIILNALYDKEGAESRSELEDEWKKIHPSFEYVKDANSMWFVHFFKEIKE